MSDPADRDFLFAGRTMLETIKSANAMGIAGVYPDSSVAEVVGGLVAEVEKLSAMLPDLRLWANRGQSIHHRDGDCTCDGNPSTTNGPEEDCPWHGREYSYWVERSAKAEELAR